jgi:hypothetical protein
MSPGILGWVRAYGWREAVGGLVFLAGVVGSAVML